MNRQFPGSHRHRKLVLPDTTKWAEQDHPLQSSVEEQQVNSVPLIADAQAALAAYEGEITAQLEQEHL